jgi:tetratricopeptide (TPR) repeat protein
MLSSATVCLEEAKKRGAGRAEFFLPGFPPALAERVADQGKEFDVVFSGQWTPAHVQRNALVDALAADFEAHGELDRLGLFISVLQGSVVTDRVARIRREALWGLRMYRGLRSGRIVLNAAIDLADREPGNMRLFETAGSGAFLLTERHPGLGRFLEPGREVETFATPGEMIEKIRYYLAHETEREAIALRGQQRCLTEHGMPRRAEKMDGIIRELLDKGRKTKAPQTDSWTGKPASKDLEQAERLASEGRLKEAEELLDRILAADPENARAWNDLGAIRHAQGHAREARRCFARALYLDPDHPGALDNLRALLSGDPVREPA